MKIVMIIGAFSGDGSPEAIKANIAEAEKYALVLEKYGIGYFCPHTHTVMNHNGHSKRASEDFFYELDLTFMHGLASGILAIPNWQDSKGAIREHKQAKEKGLKIFYPKNPDDIADLIVWYEKLERPEEYYTYIKQN